MQARFALCQNAEGCRQPWFYGLGRITWSAQCTTDMQTRCNGLRASLHFRDREETQLAIGNGSHAALQACHDSGHAAQPRGVTRSLSGSGEDPPAKGTTSNSDEGCLQVQLTAQIKRMQDEIVALQRQVAILQAHLSDATGCIAVAVHPQLDVSPAHSQCAWQGHPSETPRCIAKVI